MSASLTRAFSALGLTPPAAIIEADAIRLAVSAFANAAEVEEGKLLDLIALAPLSAVEAVAAVKASADARVSRAAALGVFRELDRSFTRREHAALRLAGAEVLDLVRPHAVAAFSDLSVAVSIVGALPDSKAMTRGGPNAGAALDAFGAAVAILQSVGLVVGAIQDAKFSEVHPTDVCWYLDPDTEGADIVRARNVADNAVGNRHAAVVAAGFVCGLNSLAAQAELTQREREHLASAASRVPARTQNPRDAAHARAWGATVAKAGARRAS